MEHSKERKGMVTSAKVSKGTRMIGIYDFQTKIVLPSLSLRPSLLSK